MEEQTKQEVPKTNPKPSKSPEPPVSGPLAQFEAWLYDMLVVKAPFQLPAGVKEWIVKYGPWIALVGGILAILFVVPTFFAALAVTSYSSAVLGGVYGAAVMASVGPMFYISLVVLALQLIILFVSVPMLLKRQRKGWMLVFYSEVISLVYTVLNTFSYGYFNFGTLLGGLIGAAIGFYFVFQIRSYYKS
jgi:hypothetical protein